jgi:hypothetical protein
MNMPSGIVFTTLSFLRNSQMGPKARALDYTKLDRLARSKHSNLLGPFISFKANEV